MKVFSPFMRLGVAAALSVSCVLLGALALAVFLHWTVKGGPLPSRAVEAALGGLGAFVIANLLIFSLNAKNQQAEALFSIILNGVNDGIFDWNIKDDTTYYSSYEHILGYSAKELGHTQEKFRSLVHPEDAAASWERVEAYAARKGSTYENTFRMRHKDGHWVWVLSRGVGFWDKQGTMIRLVGTHTDVSVQKHHEEELRRVMCENERQRQELESAIERTEAANRAKTDFLATMSHEIRTPLNVVTCLARLLMKKVQNTQKREMLETLYANADLLSKLVDDLLDLSRIETTSIQLESRPFRLKDIFEILEAMFGRQMAAKGLTFSLADRTKGSAFIGDHLRVQQILTNLIANALKFTERGGITVMAECEPTAEGAVAKLVVADTGVGIPPDKLSTIFEKFVQADQTISRRFGGSGLGLAISKSLAVLMGGEISAASTLGVGSEFTLTLPLKLSQEPFIQDAEAVSAEEFDAPMSRGVVLLVEDYPANVMVATMMIEQMGYEVEVATSGPEALQKVQFCDRAFDAILMDVEMPSMDGLETTRRIRGLEKGRNMHHYIVGLTAHALSSVRDRCLEAGMDDYLSKPINPKRLAQKLQIMLKAA